MVRLEQRYDRGSSAVMSRLPGAAAAVQLAVCLVAASLAQPGVSTEPTHEPALVASKSPAAAREISWWWDDDHHPSADGLINFCTEHRNIVSRVMLMCEVFTCVATDWSNASAPRGTCTNNNGVGGTVTGNVSQKCQQAISALTKLGVKAELWLGEDDSISSAAYMFAHANETAASLLSVAAEHPGLSGFNFDLETNAPFFDSDRLAYSRFLSDVTHALRAAPAGPLRVSADLECTYSVQYTYMHGIAPFAHFRFTFCIIFCCTTRSRQRPSDQPDHVQLLCSRRLGGRPDLHDVYIQQRGLLRMGYGA